MKVQIDFLCSLVSKAALEVSKHWLWSKFNENKIGSWFTSVNCPVFTNLSLARTNSSAHNVLYVSHTYLEFHLLSLLGVDSHNMLVMPECVSAVLLLCGHVSLQSLQHALWLEDKIGERIANARQWDKGTDSSHTLPSTEKEKESKPDLARFLLCCFPPILHDEHTWGGSDCTAVR